MCEINSPLHYLLVDVVLYYITTYCINSKYLIVTNADNSYSLEFFNIFKKEENFVHDILASNMVWKGMIMQVSAEVGKIDLGGYGTSRPFLCKNGITFLNSYPDEVNAHHYHNLMVYLLQI